MDGEELGLLDGAGTGDEGGGGGEESFIEDEQGSGGGEGDVGDAAEGGEGDQDGAGDADADASRAIVKAEPQQIRKALREIATNDPEFAKKFPRLEQTVTSALHKVQQLNGLGGLQKVAQVFEALEVYGGVDEVGVMAEDLEMYRELEQGFERGDAKVIDGWIKDFPAGFKKIMVPALDALDKLDQVRGDELTSMQTVKIFDRCGVFTAFASLGETISALTGDKKADAIKHFNDLAKFLGSMKELAVKARQGRTDRDDELDEREKTQSQREMKEFYGSVRTDVNTQIMAEMNRLIRLALPKGRKIKVEPANRLRKNINTELNIAVNTEKGYAEKYTSVMNARNKERSVRFIVSAAKAKMPAIVKTVMREMNFLTPAASANGAGAGNAARRGSAQGNRVVAGRPKTSEIDFTRTDKSMWLRTMNSHGTAWLLTGKQAKW